MLAETESLMSKDNVQTHLISAAVSAILQALGGAMVPLKPDHSFRVGFSLTVFLWRGYLRTKFSGAQKNKKGKRLAGV
ncbi:MAG: hypothetical protein ACI8Z1_003220 [Candidatus Azotimanducaceae bacterium]